MGYSSGGSGQRHFPPAGRCGHPHAVQDRGRLRRGPLGVLADMGVGVDRSPKLGIAVLDRGGYLWDIFGRSSSGQRFRETSGTSLWVVKLVVA